MPGILAEGTLTFLIYLFIAIIWVVGKILQQKEAQKKVEELKRRREEREREAQRTGQPVSPEPEQRPKPKRNTLEEELQEFLGKMAGLPPEPEPESPPPPPPKPRVRETVQFDGPPPPPPRPKPQTRQNLANAIEKAELPKGGKSVEDVYAKIADIKEIEELELAIEDGKIVDQSSLLNVRTLMVDMSKSNVQMQRIKIQNIRPVRTKTSKPNMGNRANIKQAIVGGILLSQPKALREDPFHSNPGEL